MEEKKSTRKLNTKWQTGKIVLNSYQRKGINSKTYILYAKELPILKENIYAGELTDTQLLPVDTKLIPYFEKLIDLILKKAE